MNPEIIAHLLYGAFRSALSAAWRSGSGSSSFVRTFSADGLRPFSPSARDLAPRVGRCIGCGGCEQARYSPRTLLDASRGLYDLHVASAMIEDLASLGSDRLARMQQDCPANIPFARMVAALEELRGEA